MLSSPAQRRPPTLTAPFLVSCKENTEPPKPGFKLIFEYSLNEYLESDMLEKTDECREVGYSGDSVYTPAIGTEIKWEG
jgi:nucleosome assembly protein 1-like 1